jgi:cytochrome c peroxidase
VRALLLAALLTAAGDAAAQQVLEWTPAEIGAVAQHGPWPPPPARDPSNRVSGNPDAIALGRHLFEEPRLSPSGQVSCADCHQAARQWSDGRKRGFGLAELDRRTPSLWNSGYQHWFAWDGAADSLWMQSLRAVLDPR